MADSFDIVTALESNAREVNNFLNEHFSKGEPLNLAAGVPPVNKEDDVSKLQETLAEGLSLLAVSKKDQSILGVCVNKTLQKSEAPKYKDDKIGRFLTEIETKANIWKVTGVDSAFSIALLAVSERSRGKGVGKALMEHSREKAKSEGYPLLYVLCTSYFSIRISRAMGMQSIYTLPYSEYKDQQGNMLVPPPPHTEAIVFVQKL